MTATYASTNAPLPHTQNTAPVLEFRCLYTFDVRRKNQKRWQDGFLRFHTFNKRIMVYDVPRNFIGDTHWKESWDLQEGDEIALEKGILVQVEDPVATTQTDLTPLLEKRAKMSPSTNINDRNPTKRLSVARNVCQPRNKPLHALLGTPQGAYGRALLPTRSPFEERTNTRRDWNADRPLKRPRLGDSETGFTVTKTTRPSLFASKTPILSRMINLSAKCKAKAIPKEPIAEGQTRLSVKEVIDVTSDDENERPSDLSLLETPHLTRSIRTLPKPPSQMTPSRPAITIPSSPPVSVSNKVVNVQRLADEERRTEAQKSPVQARLPVNPQTRALKLGRGNSRATLLCQPQVKPKAQASSHGTRNESKPDDDHPSNILPAAPEHGSRAERTGTPIIIESSDSEQDIADRTALVRRGAANEDLHPVDTRRSTSMSRKSVAEAIRNTRASSTRQRGRVNATGLEAMALVHGQRDQEARNGTGAAIAGLDENAVQRDGVEAEENASRPFRRVRSENDAPSPTDETTESITSAVQARPQARASTKRSLRRTNSLGAGKTARRPEPKVAVEVDTDVGPWSTEAFDLFDWRPPAKDQGAE